MLGRGHPLTMALLADLAATGEVPDTLADAPDLISTLLESFLREVPSQAHLTGLAACAIAWLTTEDLLVQLVGADAPAVWRWLARRPFITSSPRGLFAHDLARDVLDAEFERRAPERYRSYGRIVYAHAVAGLRAAPAPTGNCTRNRCSSCSETAPSPRRSPPCGRGVPRRSLRAPRTIMTWCARSSNGFGRAGQRPACPGLARWSSPSSSAWCAPATVSPVSPEILLCPTGSVPWRTGDPVVRAVARPHRPGGTTAPPAKRVRGICRFCAGAREHQRDPYAMLVSNVSHFTRTGDPLARVVGLGRRRPQVLCASSSTTSPSSRWSKLAKAGGLRHVALWHRHGDGSRSTPGLDLMRERARSGETGPPTGGAA